MVLIMATVGGGVLGKVHRDAQGGCCKGSKRTVSLVSMSMLLTLTLLGLAGRETAYDAWDNVYAEKVRVKREVTHFFSIRTECAKGL